MLKIHAAFGRRVGLWALGVFIPTVMVPLMIYHAGLDAWQDPIAFIYLHLVLLVLFPALLLPIALLNRDSRGALAWATAVALILYTAFYAAYDALGGLMYAIVYENAKQTGDPTIATFARTHIGDDAIDLVQYIGALGWTAALGLTIVHWWRAGSRSPFLGLLGISAIALWWNHPGLPGVITYGSLALATLLLPLFGRSARQLRPELASAPHV
jgi:hypothetical protein